MNIVETRLGGFELVVEKHDLKPSRYIRWEKEVAGEFILDIGKFSLMFSNMRGNETRTCCRALRLLALAALASTLVSCVEADAFRLWEVTTNPHP